MIRTVRSIFESLIFKILPLVNVNQTLYHDPKRALLAARNQSKNTPAPQKKITVRFQDDFPDRSLKKFCGYNDVLPTCRIIILFSSPYWLVRLNASAGSKTWLSDRFPVNAQLQELRYKSIFLDVIGLGTAADIYISFETEKYPRPTTEPSLCVLEQWKQRIESTAWQKFRVCVFSVSHDPRRDASKN